MATKIVTPQEAHDLLTREAGSVYVDVRTVEEFSTGHPEGAVNIPIAFPDPARGMVMNPDFVPVVQANYPKEKKIVLGCKAGPRSDAAARLLEEVGYEDVSSVRGGFGGMLDRSGQVVAPGWASLGLPVSNENGEGVSYESLAAKTK